MQGYLTAAAEISRLAVGDPRGDARARRPTRCRAGPRSASTSRARRTARAAASRSTHTFPADGEYRFRVSFYHETTGALYGNGRAALHTAEAPEQVEISIDGERVALLDVDRWMNTSDPDGVNLRTEPIAITAGPHRVSAAFIRRFEGPVQDLITPLDWSTRQHQHRRRLRLHHAAAPARPGDHRAVRRHRRVRDAEPPQDLHLPAAVAGRSRWRARATIVSRAGVAGVPPPLTERDRQRR